jgi:mRNA-degrading endonuclease toxin of MazEF toxin-antitoxin module
LDKRRPAVILSPEMRNRLANDVIIVPCSTSARAMAWHVLLRPGEAGLSHACMAKCEQIATVPKSWVDPEELGRLSPGRMREVELAVLSALGILVPGAAPPISELSSCVDAKTSRPTCSSCSSSARTRADFSAAWPAMASTAVLPSRGLDPGEEPCARAFEGDLVAQAADHHLAAATRYACASPEPR